MSTFIARKFGRGESASAALLTQLEGAHYALLKAMSDLDKLTRGPLPAKAAVIDARWNISRASLARRTLWNRIHAHFFDCACQELAFDLRQLQEGDRDLLRASTEHVGKWRIETVMRDWSTYCEASRAIRWKMKAAIGAEKRVLYAALAMAGSKAPNNQLQNSPRAHRTRGII